MAAETMLTYEEIPEYVRHEADVLSERFRNRECGEALGILACAIATNDGAEAALEFIGSQVELVDQEKFPVYEKAEAWGRLAWYGNEQARDTAWGLLDASIALITQSHHKLGYFNSDMQYLAEKTANSAYRLARLDRCPENFEKARAMAKLAATAEGAWGRGVSANLLAWLYKEGDAEGFSEALGVFDNEISLASDERTIEAIRSKHDRSLETLGREAAARDRFDQVEEVLERISSDSSRALIYAVLLGKGRADVLPFIEEFLAREFWEGGWRPVLAYELAKAGYQPAIERLHAAEEDVARGVEEERLLVLADVGADGALNEVLEYINDPGTAEHVLYQRLADLYGHGYKTEALEIAQGLYAQLSAPVIAYWLWRYQDRPNLTLWPNAYVGAKMYNADPPAPARALYTLARLATHGELSQE